ncbi:MAG: bL17 family ribosomal protein [Planctomycetota bacterium]|nr:bL17 family ribosomal protein [Planctomycetota bacterium]
MALRRRAFALLRDQKALKILFDELGERFVDREGGYTRVVRLSTRRLGDAVEQAIFEFVGDRDRVKRKRSTLSVSDNADTAVPLTSDE